ncbi:STAS domain-containing protein [Cellulomonas sp. KRMCY2]|uniref:STAS domain-containing protein n=1 Tax=Cellulomonas sp. KRMCY2 TaxID=1304865 RepID=UPI00045EB051|nr:STAS domain-containing protein [Cellulomonas sp. KRMCY2]
MPETRAAPVGGITVVEQADCTVAHLWGEIDESLRDQASTALMRALDRDLPVVLDTSEVRFIDSTGVAFLIQFCRVGRDDGLSVRLHEPPQVVTDVLEMLGMRDMFDDEPSGRREPEVRSGPVVR